MAQKWSRLKFFGKFLTTSWQLEFLWNLFAPKWSAKNQAKVWMKYLDCFLRYGIIIAVTSLKLTSSRCDVTEIPHWKILRMPLSLSYTTTLLQVSTTNLLSFFTRENYRCCRTSSRTEVPYHSSSALKWGNPLCGFLNSSRSVLAGFLSTLAL